MLPSLFILQVVGSSSDGTHIAAPPSWLVMFCSVCPFDSFCSGTPFSFWVSLFSLPNSLWLFCAVVPGGQQFTHTANRNPHANMLICFICTMFSFFLMSFFVVSRLTLIAVGMPITPFV